VVSFPQVFPPKPWIQLSSRPYVLHARPIAFQPYLIGAQLLVRNQHPTRNRWFEISNVWRDRRNITYPWCCHLMQIPFLCKLFHDANDCLDYTYAPNPTWTDLGPNPCLRYETPATHPPEQLHTLHLFF
jgi:hypothetical protein